MHAEPQSTSRGAEGPQTKSIFPRYFGGSLKSESAVAKVGLFGPVSVKCACERILERRV